MKKYFLWLMIAAALLLAACGKQKEKPAEPVADEYVTVGFSQVGAESDWRNTNTKSMKDSFTKRNGYNLIFDDGQQKQSNQITAIRQFIQQEVDYIVLAPVTESGWDTVLREAYEARIPVIIVDRMVDVKDNRVFASFVGSDFELEAQKVCTWLHDFAKAKGIGQDELRIVNIQGNIGATAQIGRTKGLVDCAEAYEWQILEMTSGDFTQTRGREIMEYYLNTYPDLNVVYCENDNMAFGAIEAIEAAGRVPGSDIRGGEIMVLSFDGVSDLALDYVKEGKITCIGECNPLHGPRVSALISKLENGEIPPKYNYVSESILTADTTVRSILVGGTEYFLVAPKADENVEE